ncbi:MAG: site-specific DNA-methyltransferase [Nitrospirae bacterium]|nr:site-specific DNA-methyltransferase [Nitrospirota bacterium]
MPTLQFKGKQLVQNHHLVVPFHELKPVRAKSVTDKISLHDNVIIHGDNLAALKALLPTHQGKIKCIYIDPPYNTGNEGWVYNDNVNDPMIKEWLGKVVDKEDLTRHDKWLCMMWPRMRLLRDLLSEDGVIFISIDDNEEANLKCALCEIFGENNFAGRISWRRRHNQPNDKTKMIAKVCESIFAYFKNAEAYKRTGIGKTEITGNFANPDNDPRGDWASKPWKVGEGQSGTRYKIILPTGKIYDEEWMGEESTYMTLLADNRIVFTKNGDGLPRKKYFKIEREEEGQCATNWWPHDQFGHNQEATDMLAEIFGKKGEFDNPKPIRLVKSLIEIGFVRPNDIILDSFAGSGTTAHAVLALNKEDGGNRKFVLIEMLDYADAITAERVRRVIKGVPNARDEDLKEGLGGTFSYFELGNPVEIQTILNGTNLPQYKELARYVFFMATGEQWNEKELEAEKNYIGESRNYHVYLFYQRDVEYLKNTALTLTQAEELPEWKVGGKRRLIFAPTKYLDQDYLDRFGIDFARLPYEIYQLAGGKKQAEA